VNNLPIKLEFHDANTDTDTNTDIIARILADTTDARFPEVIPIWQVQPHADILATILAGMSAKKSVTVSVFVSAPWNVSLRSLADKGTARIELATTRVTSPTP